MKKKLLLIAAAVGLGACRDVSTPSSIPAPLAPALSASTAVVPRPGHHIFVFRGGVADPPGLARALVRAHRGTLEQTYQYAIKGFAAALSDSAVAVRD